MTRDSQPPTRPEQEGDRPSARPDPPGTAGAPIGAAPHLAGPRAGAGQGAFLWLARHAEVHVDWQPIAYGSQDVPLSPEGELRSDELARSLARLEPDQIVSSDLQRAARLGRELARVSGAPIEFTPGLREIARGEWEEMTVADLRRERAEQAARWYADPWSFDEHGGESDAVVVDRAWPPLERALHSGARQIVVTAHYNVLRCVVSAALGLDPSNSFSWRLDKACCALLIDTPNGFQLAASNLHDPGAFQLGDEHLNVGPKR